MLNAFPYASGHLMVMPTRHVADLEDVTGDESAELWAGVADAVRALKASYRPDGLNVGANVGAAAGQTIFHVHFHLIPRFAGDAASPEGGERFGAALQRSSLAHVAGSFV